MKLARTKPAVPRGGFTLIELLVVIAIIAILVSLTTAAVFKVLGQGPMVTARHEMGQLSLALEQFKSKFGEYPPSRIRHYPHLTDYSTSGDKVDADSVSFLKKMFPRIVDAPAAGGVWTNPATGINWGAGTTAGTRIDLEGHQCLVFFLGGVETGAGGANGCLGFGTDPHNPMNLTAGTMTGTPFFDFKADRLAGTPGAFYFLDAWGKQPYAYFSSGKSANNYNRHQITNPTPPPPTTPVSDCASLGVFPYFISVSPTIRYHNPETFQIISAGEDKLFGPGGQWTPQTALGVSINGRDDLTNFHGKILGASD